MLVTGSFPWKVFVKFYAKYGEITLTTSDAGISDKILGFFVLVLCVWFLNKIYITWGDVKSEYQKEKEEFGQLSNILVDFLEIATDRESREKIKKIAQDENYIQPIFSNAIDKKRPWAERAVELFHLSYPYYSINLENGCFPSMQLYIAENNDNHKIVAISCENVFPTDNRLSVIEKFFEELDVDLSEIFFFIDGNKKENSSLSLSAEYQIFYEEEILDKLAELKHYHQYLFNEFNKKQFGEYQQLSLENIYCKNSGLLHPSSCIDDLDGYLLKWVNEHSRKQLAILGEYGQGKSVLCLKIALEIFQKRNELVRTPIVIELRGKSPRTLSMYELLAVWSVNYHCDPTVVRLLFETGRLVLIFDAFDEMDLIGDPEVRMQHFRSLWQFASHPKSKIIITGRPNLFLDEVSLKRALGIQEPSLTLPYCEAIQLNKFSLEQIKHALRDFDSSVRNEIIALCENIDSDNTFLDLISRPSTLTLVASIWPQVKDFVKSGGATSASIIKEFINHTYSRQHEKLRENVEARPIMSVPEREYFMSGIALSMLVHSGLQNQIDNKKLQYTIMHLLDKIPAALSKIPSVLDCKGEPLKKRVESIPHGKESVISDVCASGILVRDPSSADAFRFAHKSFLEFLVANSICNFYVTTKDEKEKIISMAMSNTYSGMLFERMISREIAVFVGQLILKDFDHSLSDYEKAKELLRILFPISFSSFTDSVRLFCLRAFKTKLSHLLGPYEVMLLDLIIGRLRVFAAYSIVELKLSDDDLKKIVGKKILTLIKYPKFDKVFSLKEKIFHRNFNLIDEATEILAKRSA